MSEYLIKETLMKRDNLTEAAALEQIEEVVAAYLEDIQLSGMDYESLEDILRDEFQLEPDYMLDFFEYLN